MGVFTPAEHDRKLYFVSFLEEPLGPAHLERQVVVPNLYLQTHLAKFAVVLRFSCLSLSLGLVIQELAVVQEAADRRDRVWGHLYEVEASLTGLRQRVSRRNDTKTLTIIPDYEDFGRADALISPDFAGYTSILALCWSSVML